MVYNIVSPYLVVAEPAVEYDRNQEPETKYKVLEQYYNDIYKLFLIKFAEFDRKVITTETDRKKLASLLTEIINVKTLLEEERH